MMNFYLFKSYLKYLSEAKSRQLIHSPFVYDLVEKVIRDKTNYEDYDVLHHVYEEQCEREDPIETVDFGAGAGSSKYTTKTLKKGKIVKSRTTQRSQLKLLYRLSKYFQPSYILELGTAAGISASYLKKGYPPAHLTTLEGCASLADFAEDTFRRLDIDDIESISGNFDITLDETLESIQKLDLVFFDGNHRKEPTLRYFHSCLNYAGENSLFIFDDIHWSKGMEEAWELIKTNEKVSITIDLFSMGLVFFRKDVAKQDFVIRN